MDQDHKHTVRLLQAGPFELYQLLKEEMDPGDEERIARLLQLDLERPELPEKEDNGGGKQWEGIDSSDHSAPAQKEDYPPPVDTCSFLYVSGRKFFQETTEEVLPDWYDSSATFSQGVVSTTGPEILPEPLIEWAGFWPYLHTLFQNRKKTNSIDISKVVQSAVRQEPLQSIPWTEKPQWPGKMCVVADFSRHLTPYFKDYQLLVESLTKWFGDRAELVICTDAERQRYLHRGKEFSDFPIQSEHQNILYLGDLGFLDQNGAAKSRWSKWVKQVTRRTSCIEAILTVDPADWDHRLTDKLRMHHLDNGIVSSIVDGSGLYHHKAGAGQTQLDELLSCLALAFEITPALVRELRKSLGMTISVESLVFQSDAFYGNFFSFQWVSESSRQEYFTRFEESNHDPERIWSVIERFESRIPLEVQIEQRHKAKRPLSEKQQQFLQRLVASVHTGAVQQDEDMILEWVGRVGKRAGQAPWSDEFKELYGYYAHMRSPVSYPEQFSSTKVSDLFLKKSDYQAVSVQYDGRNIAIIRETSPSIAGRGFNFGKLTVSEKSEMECVRPPGTMKFPLKAELSYELPADLEKIVCSTGSEELTISAKTCPPWAKAIGRDRYGLFAEVKVRGVSFIMRWIEPGRFMMGSPEHEPERLKTEGPQHEVALESGFWLAETACSQELWKAVTGENPSSFTKGDSWQNPVETVSWDMVKEFVRSLNVILEDHHFSLPSEAQWEYACRAGTSGPFWFGDSLSTDQANFHGEYPYNKDKKGEFREKTMPVKSFDPNPWGLYQMHGNVWEWCEDRWHDSYEGAPKDGRSWTDGEISRVLRGGSWNNSGWSLRSASRDYWLPADRLVNLGFRLARGPEELDAEAAVVSAQAEVRDEPAAAHIQRQRKK